VTAGTAEREIDVDSPLATALKHYDFTPSQRPDRTFLDIGNGVVFGAGAKLSPHVVRRTETGQLELLLASITIGDRAVIGGYSVLAAGTVIAADECTRACLLSPSFSRWRNGRRERDKEMTESR